MIKQTHLIPLLLVATICSCALSTAIPKDSTTRDILVDFFNSTNGSAWKLKQGWLSSSPVCTWSGVACDANNNVVSLSLYQNSLSGTIPSSLGKLSSLQSLHLWNNDLAGTIPSTLGQLTQLKEFHLGWNALSGTIPASFVQLQQLELFYAFTNLLTGDISVVEQMTGLKRVALDSNLLAGTISPMIQKLSELIQLDLSANNLSGTIPAEIGELSNVSSLDFSLNQLTGTIPAALGKLGNLANLHLDSNGFTSISPSYVRQKSLVMCGMRFNKFRCPIPKWTQYNCYAQCN